MRKWLRWWTVFYWVKFARQRHPEIVPKIQFILASPALIPHLFLNELTSIFFTFVFHPEIPSAHLRSTHSGGLWKSSPVRHAAETFRLLNSRLWLQVNKNAIKNHNRPAGTCTVIVIAVYCKWFHMFISENEYYKMFGMGSPLQKALEGDRTNLFPVTFRAGQSGFFSAISAGW